MREPISLYLPNNRKLFYFRLVVHLMGIVAALANSLDWFLQIALLVITAISWFMFREQKISFIRVYDPNMIIVSSEEGETWQAKAATGSYLGSYFSIIKMHPYNLRKKVLSLILIANDFPEPSYRLVLNRLRN